MEDQEPWSELVDLTCHAVDDVANKPVCTLRPTKMLLWQGNCVGIYCAIHAEGEKRRLDLNEPVKR